MAVHTTDHDIYLVVRRECERRWSTTLAVHHNVVMRAKPGNVMIRLLHIDPAQ